MTDISMAYRSDTNKYTCVFVAICPNTSKVFLRLLPEKAESTLDSTVYWGTWEDFGTPDPDSQIKGVGVTIQYIGGNDYSAQITIVLNNEVTWLRAIKEKPATSIDNPIYWGDWKNFGDPNP